MFCRTASRRETGGSELARDEGISAVGDWVAEMRASRASALLQGFWGVLAEWRHAAKQVGASLLAMRVSLLVEIG